MSVSDKLESIIGLSFPTFVLYLFLRTRAQAESLLLVSQEKVTEPSGKSSHLAARTNVAPYAMPMIPMDNDDGISYKGFSIILSTVFFINYES